MRGRTAPPKSIKRNTSRLIALFEASKGVLVLLVAFGLHALLHHDAQVFALKLVEHLHLRPGAHFSQVFIEAVARLTDARLWWLSLLAATYSVLRFIEAWGLWFVRRWAEWLALVSGGVYLPVEFYELWRKPTVLHLVIVSINLGIVAFMAVNLWLAHRQRRALRGDGKK
ncbi:MAG: DUF2127 domain-containing protein [Betaproteobacteria bacterium]|nr:DUF2127 domain-containing protein [Betaproteobacteria bacterium]